MTDMLTVAGDDVAPMGARIVPEWVVLVSGWSFAPDMWSGIRAELEDRGVPSARILCLGWYELGHWLFGVDSRCPVPAPALGRNSVWVGWSLGASLALEAMGRGAISPRRLIVLSATPRHLAEEKEKWPGLSMVLWRNLRRNVRRDVVSALADFDAWSGTLGRAASRITDPEALLVGLDWLARIDRRALLANPGAPICWIYGSDDPLVPDIQWPSRLQLGDNNRWQIVPGARHDIPWAQRARVVSAII